MDEPSPTSGSPDAPQRRCQVTGHPVAAEDLVEFQGLWVCAEGKQVLLDRLRSGESVTPVDALPGPVSSWRTVRGGMQTMYVSAWIMLIGWSVTTLAGLAMGFIGYTSARFDTTNPFTHADGVVLTMMGIPSCVVFLSAIAFYVGMCMCCSVPPVTLSRGWIIASIILAVIWVPMMCVPFINLLGLLVVTAGFICLMLFFRKLNLALDQSRTANSAVGLIVYGIVASVSYIVLMGVLISELMPGPDSPATTIGFVIVASMAIYVVLYAVGLIWLMRLIRATRRQIDLRLEMPSGWTPAGGAG